MSGGAFRAGAGPVDPRTTSSGSNSSSSGCTLTASIGRTSSEPAALPIDSTGKAAVSLLVSQMEAVRVQPEELLFEPELVVRGSTGPAPARKAPPDIRAAG